MGEEIYNDLSNKGLILKIYVKTQHKTNKKTCALFSEFSIFSIFYFYKRKKKEKMFYKK